MHQNPTKYRRFCTACLLAVTLVALWGIFNGLLLPAEALSSSPPVLLRLRSGTIDPVYESTSGKIEALAASTGPQLYIVQFSGPIQDAWFARLSQSPLAIVTYIPDYAYLVWGTRSEVMEQQQVLPIRWTGAYLPDFAVHPQLATLSGGIDIVTITVQLYNHPSSDASLQRLKSMANRVVRDGYTVHHYRNIAIEVASASIPDIAAIPGVISVEPAPVMRINDEIQGLILANQLTASGELTGPGYLAWLDSIGFSKSQADYPIVDITDDGIDNGTSNPLHPDFYTLGDPGNPDRLVYNVNWTSDTSADGVGGHGNLNASIVIGYNDLQGFPYEDANTYQYGLGINPFGRAAGSKVFNNSSAWDAPTYDQIVSQSYNNGARIINNSWGEQIGKGDYLVDDQTYDFLVRDADNNVNGNQEISIIFSAGNSGPYTGTIGSPANAKNVISVGASENIRPTWMDGCLVGSSGANHADDIINFSARGPTSDGRNKPDIVAPGTHIIAAASQNPTYLGTTVCDRYHPLGQTLYASSSGTSHAAPAVASAASLLHWYYQNQYALSEPSPAMVKAYLINSTQYIDGEGAGGTLPSIDQGFGRLDISAAFNGLPRIFIDQSVVLRSTGKVYTEVVQIPAADHPVRITLAWTDAPGPTIGAAYVNNLDLEVEIHGVVYRGNVFSLGTSIPGGEADPRNNVESVVIPPGIGSIATIRVKATNIAGDGLPDNPDMTDQDFALVCSNCAHAPFAVLVDPPAQGVCIAESITYTVSTLPLLRSQGSISLSTSDIPLYSQSWFSINPITIEAQSQLVISVSTEAIPGQYSFDVTGTHLGSGESITKSTALEIDASAPGAVSALAPANLSVDVPVLPGFVWTTDTLASTYLLEIARDTQFASPEQTISTPLTTTNLSTPLAYGTEYFWRVTPVNACGVAESTPIQSFITRKAPLMICRDPGLAIPDYSSKGITDTLYLPAYGDILDMQVQISATHTFIGDLQIKLTHVDTTSQSLLIDRPGYPETPGCSGQDLNITLDDFAQLTAEDNCRNYTVPAYMPGVTYSPSTTLSINNSDPLGGLWGLNVADLQGEDTGVLQRWCLIPTIRYQAPGTWLYMPWMLKASR